MKADIISFPSFQNKSIENSKKRVRYMKIADLLLSEKNRITTFKQLILKSITICYFIFIISVTLMGRSNLWQNQTIMPLFYSYKDAWNNFSVTSWKNIVLNFLLFVPLGILIPMVTTKCKTFWKTMFTAILLSTSIETIQLLTGLGNFDI